LLAARISGARWETSSTACSRVTDSKIVVNAYDSYYMFGVGTPLEFMDGRLWTGMPLKAGEVACY
jgi:hypothetical protein